jgi:hypothetical protein
MIKFILTGINIQALTTCITIQNIQILMLKQEQYIKDHHLKIPVDITKLLASSPFINITMTAKYLDVSRQTASTYLKNLSS